MGTSRPLEIHWSIASVYHLEQATGFLEADSVQAAGVIRRRILKAVKRLGDMPFSGRVGRIDGTRELVVPRTPYIVVYEISATAVEVLGLWHGSRQWPESLKSFDPWNS